MLLLKNVTIKDLKNHILVENFNYSLGNNDKVAIIGEEGNGKSTFLKAIYNTTWIEEYMVMSGEIINDFHHMGYLPQQLPKEWENCSIFEYLLKDEPMEDIPYERYNDLKQYEELCKEMKLNTHILQSDQRMHSLSGGEKVKVQMIKLMARHVDLLLLDEPTNDLDIHTLEWMEEFIRSSRIPIIFISHDITLLNRAANVILHFEQLNKQTKCRSTIFYGAYDEYAAQRHSKIRKEVQVARKEKQEYLMKKIRLNDQKNAVHDALNDTVRNPGVAASLKRKMTSIKAKEKRFEKEGFSKIDSVEESIDVSFDEMEVYENKRILDVNIHDIKIEERSLIKDVHLVIKGRDKVIFIGDNGCGKSMLMKKLYQELSQRKDIRLGYMPQNYIEQMDMSLTPVQFLMEEGDKEDVTTCRELLGRMKFTSEEMLHAIRDISEGQKAKLYLLKFIKGNCNVLLLDEPTRNLSPLSSPVVIDVLSKYRGCMISVTHDRRFLSQMKAVIYEVREQRLWEWIEK